MTEWSGLYVVLCCQVRQSDSQLCGSQVCSSLTVWTRAAQSVVLNAPVWWDQLERDMTPEATRRSWVLQVKILP